MKVHFNKIKKLKFYHVVFFLIFALPFISSEAARLIPTAWPYYHWKYKKLCRSSEVYRSSEVIGNHLSVNGNALIAEDENVTRIVKAWPAWLLSSLVCIVEVKDGKAKSKFYTHWP